MLAQNSRRKQTNEKNNITIMDNIIIHPIHSRLWYADEFLELENGFDWWLDYSLLLMVLWNQGGRKMRQQLIVADFVECGQLKPLANQVIREFESM